MKQLLTLLALGCALLSCKEGTGKKNDLQKQNLHGKVKSIRKITYDAVEKFGKIEKGDINAFIGGNILSLFNEQGNITEQNIYNANGSLLLKHIYQYTYDQQGNWIKQIQYYDNKPQTIIERTIEYYP